MAADRSQTSLEDKYTAAEGWVYMTGIQALVRLPIQQRLRDEAAGLNTGGYVSGYRGSPLGRYDMELLQAHAHLKARNVVFRAGLNEDLAATAIWGSQQVGNFPGAKVDGVFGIWYGKGPGVDRSGDALRHANLAGSSRHGGVVCIAGDDHGSKSSTVANFSDPVFMAVGMPVLYPSNTQELLDFGLHGIAMSRFSGCWIGLKAATDVVEGGGSVFVSQVHPSIRLPDDEAPGALSIRVFDPPLVQERRLYEQKLQAALRYAQANGLNHIVAEAPDAEIGVISAGKAWQDTLQALKGLAPSRGEGAQPAVRLLKIGLVWPLDPQIVRRFAASLKRIVIVEEKRPVLEEQVRAILYGTSDAPEIIGKYAGHGAFDAQRGRPVFGNWGELSPASVAAELRHLLGGRENRAPTAAVAGTGAAPSFPIRPPSFCSGCPHNRSTKVIEGSRALAGIGCHAMATLLDPQNTNSISHMGAEGVMWLGQQPFTGEKHVFTNLGDGTYSHSGFLAIRQALAAGVPITYKLLYNGFVSMTGGQAVESGQSPAQILGALAAEGVAKMAVVTDEPEKYQGIALPAGVPVHHRSQMDAVQREFREFPGVSVILYDQPCATERRRLRKRGKWADPPKRTFINSAVCEGCGDCGQASNCMSIEPLETELGRKRQINQASCNKDFSCIEGFCPSFVTVYGGKLRKAVQSFSTGRTLDEVLARLPMPAIPPLVRTYSILVGGIGGTGVVTVGQTLAVAAHVEGHFSSNLDITGLAQKYGAVGSHVRIAPEPSGLHATRIASSELDLLIGCDLVVAAGEESMSKLAPGRTVAVVSNDLAPTAAFARNPDWHLDAAVLERSLRDALGDRVQFMRAQTLAAALVGDPIGANMFMLGAAWQRGHVPLSLASLLRAIELNGVSVDMNKAAFAWGRFAAHDPNGVAAVTPLAPGGEALHPVAMPRKIGFEDTFGDRCTRLEDYGQPDLLRRYRAFVERVRDQEQKASLGDRLSRAVAHNHHRLLAFKDEWEVARLYSAPEFLRDLTTTFDGEFTLHFHLGAWPFARQDKATGRVLKREAGPWVLPVFRLMRRLRFLRNSWLDPFRSSAERRFNDELMAAYERDVQQALANLNAANVGAAVSLASWPQKVRGFGHVRVKQWQAVQAERTRLLSELKPAGTEPAPPQQSLHAEASRQR